MTITGKQAMKLARNASTYPPNSKAVIFEEAPDTITIDIMSGPGTAFERFVIDRHKRIIKSISKGRRKNE